MKSVLWRVFRESDEVPRTPRKANQDLRDYPTYTIPEAAAYLAIPPRTLYHWVSDDPLWRSAGIDDETRLLSFRDIAQSYFIEFIRHHGGISGRKAREILQRAKQETQTAYPLLDKNIKVLFRHIVHDRPAKGRLPRHVVDLSQYPQLVIPQVVDLFATRFKRNRKGEMDQIFPWRFYKPGDESTPVTLDPQILSGRLVITGTRVPVKVVWERQNAGEDVPVLAKDYGLPEQAITDALRHLVLRKAA
jgi:uncharacterized protein (DUF433 family)/DNA-binding transcriptional MerR regulator